MAFQGVDLRDLCRPGSGLTWRRLGALIAGLPPTAPLWAALDRAEREALIPSQDQVRARRDFYKRKG